MLDAEYFDYYFCAFRSTVQWVLCGDFHQLSPVGHSSQSARSHRRPLPRGLIWTRPWTLGTEDDLVERARTPTQRRRRPSSRGYRRGRPPFGLDECCGKFAFQSIAWRNIRPTPVVLLRPYRTSDSDLLARCALFRKGDSTDAAVVELVVQTDRRSSSAPSSPQRSCPCVRPCCRPIGKSSPGSTRAPRACKARTRPPRWATRAG